METNSMRLVRQLHKIQASLLHYASLLTNFRKSLQFLRKIHNPAMDHSRPETQKRSEKEKEKECINLMTEIDRLNDLIIVRSSHFLFSSF
jgi:hypothetical protein